MPKFLVLIVGTFLLAVFGCDAEPEELRIEMISPVAPSGAQWASQKIRFHLDGATGNPFDPEQIDVVFKATDPSGKTRRHPGFFTRDYAIVIDHHHEVMRDSNCEHWEIRWTPDTVGLWEWEIIASCGGTSVTHAGVFQCAASDRPGMVRVSLSDPNYFETSDGEFFFPVGHGTRSPVDSRWRSQAPRAAGSQTHKTLNYARWFERMAANGENCCAIWMTPWWLGLEWTNAFPGYGGLGRYNQIHAAQLDRIFELAQQHGIYVLLYVMNHGQWSSWVDAEWYDNPYRRRGDEGLVAMPRDFFRSEQCRRYHENKMRYVVARWGHSGMLFSIVLCTEAEWIDPYKGIQAGPDATVVTGMAEQKDVIPAEPGLLKKWFAAMSEFVSRTDMHGHLVTIQFPTLSSGNEFWDDPAYAIVLNNAYTNQIASPEVTEPLGRKAEGIADGVWGYTRHFDVVENKPKLIAEWGGHHLHNSRQELATQHHAGIWAIAMTKLAGVTGFWWWNAVDEMNLYPQYAALARFLDGHDRRGKGFESSLCKVEVKLPQLDDAALPDFAAHPARDAIMLAGDHDAFAYVYHHSLSAAEHFAADQGSLLYPEETEAYLNVSQRLKAGDYRIEFWDPFSGKVIATRFDQLSSGDEGPRRIALPRFRVDIAVKFIPL